jgi:TonB-linked SusC/RagA family outer membrane protein
MKFYNVYSKGLLLLIFMSLASLTFAQRTITGTVRDAENGEPLIGANVIIVGTTTGTTTDFDGKYSLKVTEGTTALAFSYIGYSEIELPIGASNVIDAKLNFGEDLDEVVVIGYGEVKREDVTGAIQTISSKDFNKGAITSVQDLIVGKIAGVNITPSTGPGGGAGITIRGTSSLSASGAPLIVIDGIPIENSGTGGGRNYLNFVNPNDIETLTVLKDASATAIYGSRASGGVILITTKTGKSGGKLKVNYTGNVSVNQAIATADVLTADEYRILITDRFGANSTQANLLGDANTDWQAAIFQNALATDHNVSLSGGVKGLPYRFSVGYTDVDGILLGDNFNRTTLNLNVNPRFLDNTLQVNFSTKAMFNKNNFVNQGAIGAANAFDPTQEIYDANSPYGGYFTWTNNQGNPNGLAPTNPLAMLDPDLRQDGSNVNRVVVNGSLDYRMPFLKELRANLSLGYDRAYGEGQVVTDAQMSYAAIDTGSITDYWSQNQNQVLEFYLNYVKETKAGKIDLMGGYSWQHFYFNSYNFSRNTSGRVIYDEADESPGEYFLVSLFGRAQYTKDKFLATFTLRRDGSSRFAPENRWGLFPSAALAYKIIDNQEGILNNLKLRLSYGVTGQQSIGSLYPYLPVYLQSQPNAQYQLGNTFYNTLRPGGYDLNIKWEETATYNAGIDFKLFNDKIGGTLDYYQKYTSDLLNFIPVAIGSNLTNQITTNVGDMQNNGIEITLNGTAYRTEDWTVEVGGNATYEQNKITKLLASDDPAYQGVFTGGISGGVGNTIQIHSVGYPVSTFFVYKQKYGDDGKPLENEYEDLNEDGQITPDDRYRFENPAANWFFGINGRVGYKNLEFTFSGRAKVGGYIYNNVQSDQAQYARVYNSTGFLVNAHSDINDIQFAQPRYFSDYFVQKADFFRLDHVTLSYNLNNVWDKLSSLRVYVTAQNTLLVTNYSGLDPEVGGIDGNVYPRARTFLFGVNASF